MGFLRKKRNKDLNEEIPQETNAQPEPDETVEEETEEEDDFAPIKQKPKRPSREEFEAAAHSLFDEAVRQKQAESQDGESAESYVEDEIFEDITENDEDEDLITDTEEEYADNEVPAENIEEEPADREEPVPGTEEDTAAEDDDEEDDFLSDPEPLSEAESEKNADAEIVENPNEEEKVKIKKHRIRDFKDAHTKLFRGILMGAGAVAAAALIVYIYGCVTVPKGVMGRNIYIEDINISGLTYEEALEKVKSQALLEGQNITLSSHDKTFTINGDDAGLTAELEATVDKAMRYGKTKNIFIDGLANSLQLFARHTVVPNANVNETVVREKLSEFGKQIFGELVEHQLELGDGVTIATPGHSGFNNNTDKAWEQLSYAITHEKFSNINVTLEKGSPKDLTVEDVDNFTWSEPVDASYAMENGQVKVIPEQDGRIIDKPSTAELVKNVKEGGDPVEIPFILTPAAVKAEELQSKLFNATLASYATSYGSSTANRCANIANAASRINGKILMPGEVFSFNAAVGPRSAANGFYTAKEYVNGETVDGIGGGTCQVTSTLYNAVLYSNLAIVSRTNHMFPVGYCPLGQDATVADSGVDFKFSNNTSAPIKIAAYTSGYRVTVSIIGTQPAEPITVKINNYSSQSGGNTIVRSTRVVYNSAGQEISREQLPSSHYMPH